MIVDTSDVNCFTSLEDNIGVVTKYTSIRATIY